MANPEFEITVDYVSEGDVANLLRGFIAVKNEKIRFSGVAYGRFGGQNVSPVLSAAAKKKAKSIFPDFDKFEEELQMKLVRGEFAMKPGKGEHHHVHMSDPQSEGNANPGSR